MRQILRIATVAILFVAFGAGVFAGPAGKAIRIKVHGKLLEGNLDGDSPDRDVSIYLPPSYEKNKTRRYPVVYFLHGYTDNDEKWFGFVKHWINLPQVIDKSLTHEGTREMIVVMPNGFTRFHGSMYSNSVTTGDWEGFISTELVAYIDSHYRTIAKASSRGIAGHSMGGYGAMRIGMKHPEVFGAMYTLSACCLGAPEAGFAKAATEAEAAKTEDDIAKTEFVPRITLAMGAAWSANPDKPPFFLDELTKDGKWQDDVAYRWAANAPLVTIGQYVDSLKKLRGIAFDAGDKDNSITKNVGVLDELMKLYKIPHTAETYDGDHLNHIADRIEWKVMPFFSKNLIFEGARKKN